MHARAPLHSYFPSEKALISDFLFVFLLWFFSGSALFDHQRKKHLAADVRGHALPRRRLLLAPVGQCCIMVWALYEVGGARHSLPALAIRPFLAQVIVFALCYYQLRSRCVPNHSARYAYAKR